MRTLQEHHFSLRDYREQEQRLREALELDGMFGPINYPECLPERPRFELDERDRLVSE